MEMKFLTDVDGSIRIEQFAGDPIGPDIIPLHPSQIPTVVAWLEEANAEVENTR
jgi:hypothetical protein